MTEKTEAKVLSSSPVSEELELRLPDGGRVTIQVTVEKQLDTNPPQYVWTFRRDDDPDEDNMLVTHSSAKAKPEAGGAEGYNPWVTGFVQDGRELEKFTQLINHMTREVLQVR